MGRCVCGYQSQQKYRLSALTAVVACYNGSR